MEKAEPDKRAVERIVGALSEGLKAILGFCGRMGEHATKVAITVAMTAGVARAVNPELLEKVIEAAKVWLAAL